MYYMIDRMHKAVFHLEVHTQTHHHRICVLCGMLKSEGILEVEEKKTK